jgi:hypothetical protein
MPAPVLQFKRGNAGVAGTVPALRPGEPAISLNNFDFFIGIDTSVANNKFLGSHRYWGREDGTNALNLKLVDKDGTNYVAIKAPNTLGGSVTYTLPGIQGATSTVLTNDGSGNLTWASGSANPIFTGIATFTDGTDNTLGDANTGAVQIDGGLGVNKNVTVGGNLNVQGYTEFVGVATFKGGTINLGDSNTDDIVFGGEIKSNIVPTDDATYDIGINGKRWRNASFSGVGTFATGAVVDAVQIGITAAGEIDTSSGNLTLDSAGGQTIIDDNLSVTGISTFTGLADFNGGIDVSGAESTFSSATVSDLTAGRVVLAGTSGSLEDSANLTFGAGGLTVGAGGVNVTGVSTFSTDVVVGGDIKVGGNDIQASDGNTNITLTSNTLTSFAGDIKVGGNDIQASDGNVNITMTSNTLTEIKGDLKVTGNDIQSSTATALTLAGADVTVAGDLTVGGNDIKANDGTTALTLANTTGAVTAANDLTVQGNLYVNGNTTQVNTSALTVEDRTIDLGIVNGAAPASSTTWDLGILFNYNSSGAKKSAVIWEHGDTRFKFASVLSSDTNGTDADTPQLTVTTFAPIEIGALWVTDCAGTSQVVSCTGTERFLENITVDGGTF